MVCAACSRPGLPDAEHLTDRPSRRARYDHGTAVPGDSRRRPAREDRRLQIRAKDDHGYSRRVRDVHQLRQRRPHGDGHGRLVDTGTLSQGATAKVKFAKPDTYTYYCSFHAFMKGKVKVTS